MIREWAHVPQPAVADNAWISYLTGHHQGHANGEATGKLTAGFGARGSNPTQDGGKIGPEFTFGLIMDAALDEPVLIIKTAWGGRSLYTEFRPPGAVRQECHWQQGGGSNSHASLVAHTRAGVNRPKGDRNPSEPIGERVGIGVSWHMNDEGWK